MKEIEAIFNKEVLGPWQESCKDARLPWNSTDKLRRKWLNMMIGEPDMAVCGALGLTRCSNLEQKEIDAVEDFFSKQNELVPPQVLSVMLVTGGYLPKSFALGALQSQVEEYGTTDLRLWNYVSMVFRHPSFSIQDNSFKGSYFDFLTAANPSTRFNLDFDNQWANALKIFKSKEKPSIPTKSLSKFAYFMRSDFTKEEFWKETSIAFLDEPMFYVLIEHPCHYNGEAPEYDPCSPTNDAIRFFSGNNQVSLSWRFYNPLLKLPWNFEFFDHSTSPGIFLSMLMFGHPVTAINDNPILSFPHIFTLIGEHPSCMLLKSYLGNEKRPTFADLAKPS